MDIPKRLGDSTPSHHELFVLDCADLRRIFAVVAQEFKAAHRSIRVGSAAAVRYPCEQDDL